MSVERNREVVRAYFERYHNDRDGAVLAEIVPPELHDQTEAARQTVLTAFPDYRIEIQAQVAEGDVVATVWRASGTHQGDWDSPIGRIPATGRRVEWSGTTTLRVVDGKLADTVSTNWDHLAILQQLGVVETGEPRPGA